MGYTAIDKTVSLIHKWCKENNLPETCKTLEQEYQSHYGKVIKDPVDSSLKKIIETHQHFKLLISAFINVDSSKATGAVRRRKISESNNDSSVTSPSAVDSDTMKVVPKKKKKETNPPVLPLPEEIDVPKKKKKEPFMPPGEWVCPEMESTLCGVYDRQPLLDLSNVSTDETTDDLGNKEILAVEELPVNMFTSDSEQDSDDNNTVLITTISEAVKQTPVKINPGKKLDSDTSKDESESKMESGNSSAPPGTSNAKPKRKRRKSKKLLAHRSPVYEGTDDVVTKSNPVESNVSTDMGGSTVMEKGEKKKKKKKPKLDDNENKNSSDHGIEPVINHIDSQVRLKKKHKSDVSHEQPSVDHEMMNGTSNETEKKEKKKKKKHKIQNDELQTPVVIERKIVESVGELHKPVVIEQKIVDNSEILSNLGSTLKKKKKKKVLDVGS